MNPDVRRSKRDLGVLTGTSPIRDMTAFVDELRTRSLELRSPEVLGALTIALTHSSYLYENRQTLPDITPSVLEALRALGKVALSRATTVSAYTRLSPHTAGELNDTVRQVMPNLRASVKRAQPWVSRCCAVGKSLDATALHPGVSADLFLQAIGVLFLYEEYAVASSLLNDVIVQTVEANEVVNPKTTLELLLRPHPARYESVELAKSPNSQFRASVTDVRGRVSTGTGTSKKNAEQQAALDFIRAYYPASVRRRTDPVRRPAPLEVQGHRAHTTVVANLETLFSLDPSARGLLSQSLLHASWVYENRLWLQKRHQQDNQVLAMLGSEQLLYEQALSSVLKAVRTPSAAFAFRSNPNSVHAEVCQLLGLPNGLLLGVGQATFKASSDMYATIFQAVIGAVSVAAGFPESLSDLWPKPWALAWPLIAPATPLPHDPITLLEQAMSLMKLQVDYLFPDVVREYGEPVTGKMTITSPQLGRKIALQTGPAANKSAAKRRVSLIILDILDDLASSHPGTALSAKTDAARKVGSFLLAHQARVTINGNPSLKWASARLFGLHWAAQPQALISWAAETDEILSSAAMDQVDTAQLTEAFRTVAKLANNRTSHIDSALAETLDAIDALDFAAGIGDELLTRLANLCDLYRGIGARDGAIELSDLLDSWQLLHHARLEEVRPSVPVQLSSQERALLDAAADAVFQRAAGVSVELQYGSGLTIRLLSEEPNRSNRIRDVCALWNPVSQTTTMAPVDRGVEISLYRPTVTPEPGQLTQAALASLHPDPEPYMAAVADLLHDLKNQLVAARLASSAPAESRTARLSQDLAASRHLDDAKSLALRLRAGTSGFTPASEQSVELGGYLRHYARHVLDRLPHAISLHVPPAPYAVRASIDERALTAVLDNLVSNSIEALMPAGGTIQLEWADIDDAVVIDFSDNGPGLPPAVFSALAAGDRVSSTKPGGNGLGLLGARALIERAGGQLSALSVASGTRWSITIPTALEEPPEAK